MWALVDQGIVSLGSFATHVVIIRSSDPTLYGTFVLALAAILFSNNVHASIIIYPLSLKTALEDIRSTPSLAAPALILTVMFSGSLALIYLPFAGIANASTAAIIICAMLAWQLQEVCRRILMARLSFASAAIGDTLSYPGQALLIWLVSTRVPLSIGRIFVCMAVSSAAAALVQGLQSRLSVSTNGAIPAVKEFWSVGRWNFVNACLFSSAGPAFLWLFALMQGVAAAGRLQALWNIFGFMNPVLIGISNAIVPGVASSSANRHGEGFWSTAATYGLLGAIVIVPCLLVMSTFPQLVLTLFYGPSNSYLDLAPLIGWVCLSCLATYAILVIGCLFAGLGKPKLNFWAELAGVASCVVIGLPLGYLYGVRGAVLGSFAALLVKLAVEVFQLWRFAASARTDPVSSGDAETRVISLLPRRWSRFFVGSSS